MNRVQTLRAGTARTAAFAAAIRAAADDQTITVVRLKQMWTRHDRPYRQVVAYDARFQRVALEQDAVDAIDALIRGSRPDIYWWTDHDWHLDTGMLRRSPLVGEVGGIPEDDHTFGGTAPLFLVDAAPAPAAADTPRAAA